ncbi:MAG: hypothetical protein HY023_16940, partial [Chloroflexi bacterium]|nr:hypothetical protein [Chloroflexota bacterium]
TTDYGGVPYSSDVASFQSDSAKLDVPLKVYEVTTDTSFLRVDRMHIFFDFSGAGAVVGELFIMSNTGDKTLSLDAGLQFELPPGAKNLSIQNATAGRDYRETPTGFSLTTPILPGGGSQQILVSFSLPYDGQLAFSQKVPFPVATANVLVPGLGVKVSSDQLQPTGVRDVQGTQFQNYTATNLAAGSTLTFNLAGGAGGSSPAVIVDRRNLIVGGAGLTLAVAGLGWWLFSRRAPSAALPADRDGLIKAIADLDNKFEAGEISEKEYERQRAKLKAKLIEQWND